MTRAELHELARKLEETPARVRNLVEQVQEGVLRWKKSSAEFSMLENVCHLRDIEREGYIARIQKLLRETKPILPDINGEQLAVDRKYNAQPLEPAIAAFTDARLANVRIIRNLSAEQLSRNGALQTVGEITLEKLLSMMREHDEDHVRLIAEARKLAISGQSGATSR